MDCCTITSKSKLKKCTRKKDNKILKKNISIDKCLEKKITRYSKKASCAPYKFCKKIGKII